MLAVTSATVFFNATRSRGAPNLDTGWGYGLTADISNRKVQNTTANPFFVISFKMTFSTDGQSATGMESATSPSLEPSGPMPTRASICKSKSQTMTLTLQPPPAKMTPPATGAVMLGKSQSFPTYQP